MQKMFYSNKTMTAIKTLENNTSVTEFIKSVADEEKKKDALMLLKMYKELTGERPKMWGTSIVGFGKYHYKSERSAQQGDWPLVAFSPRKQNLTLYVMCGFSDFGDLLKDLGKHKTSVGCLYIKKLSDVNHSVLKKIIKKSFVDMKKRYPKE